MNRWRLSDTINMARRAAACRAMTLLEMAAVVAIVGLVGVMAVARYGAATISDVDAQQFARQIALDCAYARRSAIASGFNHLLRFTHSSGNATQYMVYRRQGATTTAVDDVRIVPSGVTVLTGGATELEFTFVGEALASYAITVQAPDRTWTVTVPQVTGKAFVQ